MIRQNRAVAIGAYACAPLAWVFVGAALVAIALFVSPILKLRMANSFFFLAGGMALAGALIAYLVNVFKLLLWTTHCGWRRCAATGIMMPVIWGLAALLGFGVWPVLAGLIVLMVRGI